MRALALTGLLGLALSLGACSTGLKKTAGPPITGALLFPFGEYQHVIRVTIPPHGALGEQVFHFDGVAHIDADRIRVVALTPFGTTAFKLEENRQSGEVTSEVYINTMKKYEARLRDYYALLRILLIAKRQPDDQSALRWERTDGEGRPGAVRVVSGPIGVGTEFVFKRYDIRGIPEIIEAESPNYRIDIEVTGYDI